MSFADKSTTRRVFVKEVVLGAASTAIAGLLSSWSAAAQRTKHGHLVRKIFYNMREMFKIVGPGNADWLHGLKARIWGGFIINFTWGFYTGLGNWHNIPGFDLHIHEGDEFLVFVGLDAKNPNQLGAEVELHMGQEEEIHMVNTPLVIVCPSMFTHAPVITKKVDKPYTFFLIRTDTGETYSPKKKSG